MSVSCFVMRVLCSYALKLRAGFLLDKRSGFFWWRQLDNP